MDKSAQAYENYQNYRYCYDNGHDEWVAQAGICFDFWRSKQWKDTDIAKLAISGRPALTFNIIESLVRTMKGIQRALRNDVRFMPAADADMAMAAVRDALWLHEQNANNIDFVESEIWERGLITGRAYYNTTIEFDDNMRGQIRIKPVRSQDVVLDPCLYSYDPDDWPQVYHTPWVSRRDIEHEFGKEVADALMYSDVPEWFDWEDQFMAQRLGKLPYYQYSGFADMKLVRAYRLLIRQYRDLQTKEVFVDMQTGETSVIPGNWKRDQISHVLEVTPGLGTMKRKVKTVRHVTTCENTVLRDEDSPYGMFTIVPFFPTFVDGVTFGAVENLLDAQMMYNKVTSQELHIINSTANAGWKSKVGNIKNKTAEEMEATGAQTGIFLELDDISQTEKIEPASVPQGHDRISLKAEAMMRQLSGVSNQSRGFAREDVAGEAILANQAASDVNFAAWLANLHRSKQMLVRNCEHLWKTFYNETRVIQTNRGSAYKPQPESVTLNEPSDEGKYVNDITEGKFTTILVPAPTRSSLTEGEFKELVMLKKELGVQIPDEMLIELCNAPNKARLIQALKGDSNQQQQAAAEAAKATQDAEVKYTEAKTAKEGSASKLNEARAAKFQGEASRDPDAAYEKVEFARMDLDHQESQEKFALEREKMGMQHKDSAHRTALELTKLDHGARENAKDRQHEINKAHVEGMQRRELEKSKPKPKAATGAK